LEETEDGRVLVNDEPRTPEEVKADILEEMAMLRTYSDIGDGTVTIEETEDLDWINNWKQYFHKFTVEDCLIVPSWEKADPEDFEMGRMILHIDPGTAFGTGMHETTQLCLKELRKVVRPGMEILDVGTGSGILGIAALKRGAGHVFGTDLDPSAIDAVEENLKRNEIPEGSMDVILGNLIDDKAVQEQTGYEKYDIVVANILARILLMLTPQIPAHLKSGGLYITSGILETQAGQVEEACVKAGLKLLRTEHQGEWVCVIAEKS
jgi:ribosomal protein L11 methyltransferase